VCAFDGLRQPVGDVPSFEACPCCGTEFGFDDDPGACGEDLAPNVPGEHRYSNAEYRHAAHLALRSRWVAGGGHWWSASSLPPTGWDARVQLARTVGGPDWHDAKKTGEPALQTIWRFVRRDLRTSEFERWIYAEPDLERLLGSELHLAALSTDFSNREAVRTLRVALAAFARARWPLDCLCIRLRDLDVVDMGYFPAPEPAFEGRREWSHEDVFRSLEVVAKHGAPLWWLWAARCRTCGQAWLVGQEERQYDVFCMKRLAPLELDEILRGGQWPKDFDSYETLLRIGSDAGRRVRFVDPMDSSMVPTIADLAKARPGISVAEIAKLLGVDIGLAHALALRAIEAEGLHITFEGV
jgi:hypothetical protein